MRILGIDQALDGKCGFAVVDIDDAGEARILHTCLEEYRGIPHGADRERCRQFGRALERVFTEYNPDAAVMEIVRTFHQGYTNTDTIRLLSQAQGVAAVVLPGRVPLYRVNTSSWKKEVLGSGKADKKDSINYVVMRYDMLLTHHEADAICMALYVHRVQFVQRENILVVA